MSEPALPMLLEQLRDAKVAAAHFHPNGAIAYVRFQQPEPKAPEVQRDTHEPPVKRPNPHAGGLVPRADRDDR